MKTVTSTITFEFSDNYSCCKTPRATWKVLKNANCTWSSRDCLCSSFISQLICWMFQWKEKQTFPPTYSIWERASTIGLLKQYELITLHICIGPQSLNVSVQFDWRPENEFSLVCCKLRHLSVGDQNKFCKHSRKKMAYLSYTSTLPWYTNGSCSLFCSHTPSDDGNVVCFSFKGNIQQRIFVTNIAANAASRAPHAFFVNEQSHFACGVLLSIWIIITAIEGYNTCDLMYKFL